MNQSTPTPATGTKLNAAALSFKARIALVNCGLKELRRQHNGLLAIEQMLRPARTSDDDDSALIDLFKADLAELLATVNTAFEEKIEFLLELAEANQQEVMQ